MHFTSFKTDSITNFETSLHLLLKLFTRVSIIQDENVTMTHLSVRASECISCLF